MWIGFALLLGFCVSPLQLQTSRPLHDWIRPATQVSHAADTLWKNATLSIFSDLEKRKTTLEKNLGEPLLSLEGSDIKTHQEYTKLPEIYADQGTPALFPKPLVQPQATSWFQSLKIAYTLSGKFSEIENKMNTLSTEEREILWIEIEMKLSALARNIRYLEEWIPKISQIKKEEGINELWNQVLNSEDEKDWMKLREFLKPKRIWTPYYIPKQLKGKIIPLKIHTDIQNQRFIKEFQGAIESHWNLSPWAKNNQIEFKISWKMLPENKAFKEGLVTLDEHLLQFPIHSPVITTGGLNTFVRKNVMVLGTGKITPRTLAHEFGHLLGYGDCYFRTFSGQNLFGNSILEWNNPIYPDELMCDNTLGVARILDVNP